MATARLYRSAICGSARLTAALLTTPEGGGTSRPNLDIADLLAPACMRTCERRQLSTEIVLLLCPAYRCMPAKALLTQERPRTLRVSSGWMVLCDAARAMAPASTSLAGFRSTCSPGRGRSARDSMWYYLARSLVSDLVFSRKLAGTEA